MGKYLLIRLWKLKVKYWSWVYFRITKLSSKSRYCRCFNKIDQRALSAVYDEITQVKEAFDYELSLCGILCISAIVAEIRKLLEMLWYAMNNYNNKDSME